MSGKEIFDIIRKALLEDIRSGDITTEALFKKRKILQARIIAGQPGILAGASIAMAAFKLLDPKVKVMPLVLDGEAFKAKSVIAYIEGDARSILSAERVALNFLGRLSGISTLTAKFVKVVKPYKIKIMDTRKTTPGLRLLEKYAVSVGGGLNHRMGLYDQVLIKDNHLMAAGYKWPLIAKVVKDCKKKGIKTEVEVGNIKQFKEVMKIEPDIIMLDNMSVKEIRACLALHPRSEIEVSGGVNLQNIGKIASIGVDIISIGALTHSVKAVDFSLEIIK